MSIYYVTAAISNSNVNTVGAADDPQEPFGIQAALDNSGAGDIVAIKADGQYDISASIDIDSGGGSEVGGSFKVIEGYSEQLGDGGQAVFDGGGGAFDLFKINDVSNVIIRNIYGKRVYGENQTSGNNIFTVSRISSEVANIIFENCRAESGTYGWQVLLGDYGRNIHLLNCVAGEFGNKGYDVRVSFHAGMLNCRAYNCDYDGIAMGNGLVYGCASYGNGRYGFMVYGAEGTTYLNNTSYGNGYGLAVSSSGRNCLAANNILWGNSDRDIDDRAYGTIYGSHNCYDASKIRGYNSGGDEVTEDPKFVDAGNGNFKLRADSGCFNAAMCTINLGSLNIGAWQKKQGANSAIMNGGLVR